MALNIEFKNQSKRVRVPPGMTMFQVVETSRELFGLSPTAQFELLHRGRAVDLSIPFRLTGVSNNATLELREAAAKGADANQQVRVAVQLTDGKRVQEAFTSDATLERILSAFRQLPVDAGQEFSLTFMQREISYDVFPTTTLQDLGIVSGSAMFRMVRAASSSGLTKSEATSRAIASSAPVSEAAPVPAPIKRESVAAPATPIAVPSWSEEEEKHSETPPPTIVSPPTPPPSNAVVSNDGDVEMTPPDAPVVSRLSCYDALQLLRDSCFDTVSRTAVITLMKIITNILSHPENDKMRSVRVSNAAFDRTVGQHKGGIEVLQSVGFELNPETQTLTLTSATHATPALEKALQLLHVEADDLQIQPSERPQVIVPMPVDEAFDAFKPIITRLQAQPRGPSATEVLVENLKTKQEALLQRIEKPQRNTKITFPGQQPGASTRNSQADVEMTSEGDGRSDSSLVIASMKARRIEMEKTQNFRTQAMRELDELKRKKVFQQALIRVQFPDRVILQAAFHPMETVGDVMAHMRESFNAHCGETVSFYLYVSPPLQKLAPEKTLSELGLVPAAHTYLSWIDGPQPLDNAAHADQRGWYLCQELLTPDQPDAKTSDDHGPTAYPNSIPLDEAAAAKAAQAAKDAVAEAAMKRSTASDAKAKKSVKKPSWMKL